MLDPELADGRVGLREREIVRGLGMGEIGRVEIHPKPLALAQSIQLWKCSRLDLGAVDKLAAVIQIGGVQIEAMLAGDQAEGLFQIAAQFADGARFARIVAGGLDAAAVSCAPAVSKPPTSSPCQQWSDTGIVSRFRIAVSTSTPNAA